MIADFLAYFSRILSSLCSPAVSKTETDPVIPIYEEALPEREEVIDLSTIEGRAKALKITSPDGSVAELRTVLNICDWVHSVMIYERQYYPQPLADIWEFRTGDCTDYSALIYAMSKSAGVTVGYSGLHKVHGYMRGEKHDWLIYGTENIDGVGTHPASAYTYEGRNFW